MKTNGTNYLKPNIQLFADGGGGSVATGETTPATATTVSTTPAGDGNGAQITTAATPVTHTETKPFKAFATQSEFDQFVTQTLKSREESLKAKLTPEIKAQLDKESKMTAEQKVQAQLDEIATAKKELAKEKVRIKVESLFASKGISEADRQPMLDSVVGEDEEESLKRGQALIDAIDRATNEKIKEAMTKVKAPGASAGAKEATQPNDTIGKILGHQFAEARKGASKAIDYYKVGGNRS